MSGAISAIPFGPYRLHRRLARGGMAEVFLATLVGDPQERLFAIKRTHPEVARDAVFARMFVDEMELVRHLDHPHICQNYESGQIDGRPFIAMEFVRGVNLWALIRRGHPLPLAVVTMIVARVAKALEAAHRCVDPDGALLGIVHRDVTPHNVMVSFAGEVKLLDFGIAKARVQAEQTRAGVLKGKYAYMSPEQTEGGELDHRSDIFSLGTVFYEACTGIKPFSGDNPRELMMSIRGDAPPSPLHARPELDATIVSVITTALEKNPGDRFQSAAAMARALEESPWSLDPAATSDQLAALLVELFPRRHAAIEAVVDEVRHQAGRSERGGGKASLQEAASVSFEEEADDLAAVNLEASGSSWRRAVQGSTTEGGSRAFPKRLLVFVIIGALLGSATGYGVWRALWGANQSDSPATLRVRALDE